MDRQLRKWLTETANYAAPTGVSAAGDDTFGSAVAFLCRTEIDRWFHGPNFMPRHGEDQETSIVIFTDVDVPEAARIWLPGLATTSANARRPKRREVVRDEKGAVTHYEIYL